AHGAAPRCAARGARDTRGQYRPAGGSATGAAAAVAAERRRPSRQRQGERHRDRAASRVEDGFIRLAGAGAGPESGPIWTGIPKNGAPGWDRPSDPWLRRPWIGPPRTVSP